MTFKDGELIEDEFCPKCGSQLFYEMSFYDASDSTGGHCTKDMPLKVCNKCDYWEEFEESGED